MGLQPEVCLLEMPEAHFHTEALAMHWHWPLPWSKACSSRGRSPPHGELDLGKRGRKGDQVEGGHSSLYLQPLLGLLPALQC